MTKPFLLIQTRPEDEASDNEYRAFLRYGNLSPDQLVRIRLEQSAMPNLRLDDYSGVMVGGSPYNFSDAEKSMTQQRIEKELHALLEQVVPDDFPFFGACYGIGLLTTFLGGSISTKYGEPVGATTITVIQDDPLLEGVTSPFEAFLGHKEAGDGIPDGAIHLASSATCPVQMFRVGNNVYATQFHPELDTEGLATRIRIYRNHGYFQPEEADALVQKGEAAIITEPMKILRNFTRRYQQQ